MVEQRWTLSWNSAKTSWKLHRNRKHMRSLIEVEMEQICVGKKCNLPFTFKSAWTLQPHPDVRKCILYWKGLFHVITLFLRFLLLWCEFIGQLASMFATYLKSHNITGLEYRYTITITKKIHDKAQQSDPFWRVLCELFCSESQLLELLGTCR